MEITFTKEQEKVKEQYRIKWLDKWRSPRKELDKHKVEEVVNKLGELYFKKSKTPRKFYFYRSLKQAFNVATLAVKAPTFKAFEKEMKNVLLKSKDFNFDILSYAIYGQFDSGWLYYYDFLYNEKIKQENVTDFQKPLLFMELADLTSFVWLFKDVAIVVERAVVNLDDQYNLHADGEPAMKFDDGEEIYRWHGRFLNRKYGSVLSKDWKPEWIVEEENTDTRMLLLEQIGVDRALEVLNARIINKATIDTLNGKHYYELLHLDFDKEHKDLTYLKMINPSTGTFHVEGVSNDCKTVQEAINWRKSGDVTKQWSPSILT